MIVTRYLNGGDQNFVWWWPKISMVVTGYWNGGDRILKWWWPEVCMTVTENRYGGDRKSVWEWPNSLSLWPKVYIFEWKFRRLWSDFVCCEQKFGWMVVKIIITLHTKKYIKYSKQIYNVKSGLHRALQGLVPFWSSWVSYQYA